MNGKKERLVIIGGGFGGLNLAKRLKNENLEILLIDRTNYHLFQPLLYQVATAGLSPGDIAVPIRAMLKRHHNMKVILADVISVDKEKRQLLTASGDKYTYDYLVLAPGARHSYFGNDHWEEKAPGLKTVKDALSIRQHILISFERAEILGNVPEQKEFLTFVVVGAGPTGVEMAGALAEIARKTMTENFRTFDPQSARIILLEGADRVLPPYAPELSEKALKTLEKMGIEIRLNSLVNEVGDDYVKFGDETIRTRNIIWAAGNRASPLLDTLETEQDRAGRVIVDPYLRVKDYPEIYVIGDAAHFKHNKEALPAVAPVASQQGRYLANHLKRLLHGKKLKPFQYRDKGSMATIGRAKAVAQVGNFKTSGLFAWILWTFVHIYYLIDFRNRIVVMLEWIWQYITFQKSARLITDYHGEDTSAGKK